jgi:rSAM/selenodomain-associated transferase 1
MERAENAFQPGIFIMVKYPRAGKVKARLAQSIGEEAACGLYQAFIQDTVATVESLNVPFHIAVHPPECQEKLAEWLGLSYRYFPQRGENLGDRLHNGFNTMFSHKYQQVIALASDSPDIPDEILQSAVSSLQKKGAVIGPAQDGGYYLIGFTLDHFIPEVFHGMSWSTEAVFLETLARIELHTENVHVLPKWQDIDTKRDLQEFYGKYQSQIPDTLHTIKYLRSHTLILEALLS